MEKVKSGFISKMIKHLRGVKTEMDNTYTDILSLQNRLIVKREEVRQRIKDEKDKQ